MSIHTRGLHEAIRPSADYAMRWANWLGFSPTITSVYRSMEEQRRLREAWERCVARGTWRPDLPPEQRPAGCKWPANRPGDSAHNYGLAWDSVVPEQHWPAWNFIRRYLGWRVPENDQIHAEVPEWRTLVS